MDESVLGFWTAILANCVTVNVAPALGSPLS